VKAPELSLTMKEPHGMEAGDKIAMHHMDNRWWARLLYWIFRQGKPTYQTYHEVTSVISNTTMEVKVE
jgi:hypothetical protein